MKDVEFIEAPGLVPPEAAAIKVKGFRVKPQPKVNGDVNGEAHEATMSIPIKKFDIQGRFLLVRERCKVAGAVRSPGVYFNDAPEPEDGEAEPQPTWKWVCSQLEPLADTRDAESLNWGTLLEVVDRDGKRKVWAMPASIGPMVGDGTQFRAELASRGLKIASGKGRNRLSDFIAQWNPKRKVRCVQTVGWHGGAFVMPDKAYGGNEDIILQTEGVAPQFSMAGTLADWKTDVAARAVGNSRLVFAISAAFAGPLLKLAGEESGGINFRGPSSIGKTTTLHAARSVWGVPLGSWRTTDNGAEAIAAGASDTFLNLDELGQADPKVIAAVSYMLGNQRGKTRMNRNATARASLQWRVLFLSTGEVSLATRLGEGGIKARAGQEVRVLDIQADAGAGNGIFEELHGFESASLLAEHLRLAADKNCGWPARAFLEAITKMNLHDALKKITDLRAGFVSDVCPPGADGQVRRACGRFALIGIAGEMATLAGITGWQEGEAEAAAVRLFRDWLEDRGGAGAAEMREGVAQVRAFLEAHGEARFTPAWDRTVTTLTPNGEHDLPDTKARPTINRAGFRKASDEGTIFYVLPEVWRREVCKGFDAKSVAAAMSEAGWMLKEGRGFTRKERIPGEGNQRVYVIPAGFMGADT